MVGAQVGAQNVAFSASAVKQYQSSASALGVGVEEEATTLSLNCILFIESVAVLSSRTITQVASGIDKLLFVPSNPIWRLNVCQVIGSVKVNSQSAVFSKLTKLASIASSKVLRASKLSLIAVLATSPVSQLLIRTIIGIYCRSK